MAGITEHYATPLALFLGATVQQVGLISALPHLLSSLSQFLAVRIIHWIGGRLKLLVRLVLCQASLILSIAILPWLLKHKAARGILNLRIDLDSGMRRIGWTCLGQFDH